MAEAEAEVNVESVVSETTEALPTVKETVPEAPEEPEAPEVPEAPEEPEEGAPASAGEEVVTQGAPDHKRKLEVLDLPGDDEAPAKKQEIHGSEPTSEDSNPAEDKAALPPEEAAQEIGSEQTDGSGHPTTDEPVTSADVAASDAALDEKVGEQQLGQGGEMDGAGLEHVKLETQSLGNGQNESTENTQDASVDDTQKPDSLAPEQSSFSHARQQTSNDLSTSCKIDVPNNKVGVLIGKSGDTIRYLQINSGAKIQITRDVDADQNCSTRPVELIGTLENITKAEQLIKDVIAEADAGGSPSLVARGFNAPQSGGEQTEIQIPNEKVGMIIGKGGETIKNLQTKTGARIQLIPQHLPEGDSSKERTVRITGNKKQVEYAKEMIKDVMNQSSIPIRPSSLSSTYGQQAFRPPRGPSPITQWGSRAPTSTHHAVGYGHQRGMYPTHTTQYPQTYGGYSQHPPQRGTYGSNWEQQRPAVPPLQTGPQSGGYDYYNQGGPASNTQPSNSLPGPAPGSSAAPVNYNYGQSQAPDGYGHPAPYAQPPPAQQNYGHGYNEPKYDSQPPSQQIYAQQQPMGSHPGMYGQQSATPYGKPAYGAASHETTPYGPPRGGQSGDPIYQGPLPNQYPSSTPMQHTYPHNSSAQIQQAPYGQSYGPPSGPADGYSQQSSASYPQHGVQPATGYGQAAPAYAQQVPQSGSYSQYPSSQPSYGDPTSQNNVNYGYQGGAPDAGYAGNVANAGYTGQPVGGQPTYSQPPTNPGYYDQSMPPQSGYAAPNTSVGYAKSISPQPGYGGQYDSSQMYGHQ